MGAGGLQQFTGRFQAACSSCVVAYLLLCVTGGLQTGCPSWCVSYMLFCVMWFLCSSIAGVAGIVLACLPRQFAAGVNIGRRLLMGGS